MTDENARVPDCIYLQPDCCVDWGGEGRQWCEDDVWGDDCPDHSPAIEYTRKALAAQPRDDVRELLRGAGPVAYDRDECTVTFAFDTEEQVNAVIKAIPSRHRVRVIERIDTALAPTTQGTDSGLADELERLGDALHGLSARLLLSGALEDDANHTAYEKVVERFSALAEGAGK